MTIWELLDDTNCPAPAARDLYNWSLNMDFGHRPYELFCDITGFSMEAYNKLQHNGDFSLLSYAEADYLADALKEWAQFPQRVEDWMWEAFSAQEAV